jgi:hypothetical protein
LSVDPLKWFVGYPSVHSVCTTFALYTVDAFLLYPLLKLSGLL